MRYRLRADVAGRARAVFNDDRLAQELARMLRDGARFKVQWTRGRKVDNEADRARGVIRSDGG